MSSVAGSPVDYAAPERKKRRFRWMLWLTPVLAIGLFFMLLVPTMCASREGANRLKCESNLRQIGMALNDYAGAHGGVFPDSWAELANSTELRADVFICPASNTDERVLDAEDMAVWAKDLDNPAAHHCSYRFAAAGLKAADLKPDDIVAFENGDDHAGDGITLLHADASTDWQPIRLTAKPAYDRFLADYAAGVKPLRWRD